MQAAAREEVEAEIRKRAESADHEGAATVALKAYGPEIYAFLAASMRNEDEAAEVFSLFTEGLWRGLAGFGWQSSFRTWAYAVARRTSLRYRRDAARRARWQEPLPEESSLMVLAAAVRSTTQAHLRSAVRTRISELRNELPAEERDLLLLRVERELSWLDLVQVLHEEDATPLSEGEQKREAARLRKRFQTVKDKLRELARREGLLDDGKS